VFVCAQASFDRKLKENWLDLMSAALHCLRFHY
jgi:hypothetical protein